MSVIGSLLWPGVLSRPAKTSFHWQLGDVATWLLAVLALGALIAAILAYRKQSSSDEHLAKQVRLQGDATAALADQAKAQREALADQQAANVKQAEVLEAQLAEMNQRAAAIARQQADAVTLTPGQ